MATAPTALDPSFGAGGIVLGPVNQATYDTVRQTAQVALGIGADGKVVEAETRVSTRDGIATSPLVVRRFNADGSVDTTFGTNGQVEIPFSSGIVAVTSMPHNLIIQPDGKILVAATGNTATNTDTGGTTEGLVARLTTSGRLDPTFGTGGEYVLPAGVMASNLAIDGDGKILVAGVSITTTSNSFVSQVVVVRLTTGGSPDITFHRTGQLIFTPPNPKTASPFAYQTVALAVAPGGQIYLASSGLSGLGFDSIVGVDDLTRITTAGELDSGYGSEGSQTLSLTQVSDLTVQTDGAVIVLGKTVQSAAPGPQVAVVRLLASGQVDPSFQLALPASYPASFHYQDQYQAVAIESDGKIVLGGTSPYVQATGNTDGANRLLVMRLLAAGAVDTRFGSNGRVQFAVGGPVKTQALSATVAQTSLAISSAGKIILGGGISGAVNSSASTSQSVVAQVLPVAVHVAANDYDGDGISDLAAELTGLAQFAYRKSTGGDVVQAFGVAGLGQTIPDPGDYDGDGKADIAVYLPAQGVFAYRPSSGGPDVVVPFGIAGLKQSIPAPGDYDGDGKADIAVYLTRYGVLAYRPSSGGPDVAARFGSAGTNNSLSAPGDYDGDGITDAAVYLPASGSLAYRSSANGADVIQQFGRAGVGATIPAPGDYDGDGRTDVAALIPSLGLNAYRPSSGGKDFLLGFGTPGAGLSIPAPGDYDGDGRTDIAVYLVNSAEFAYHPSEGGADVLQRFGAPGVGQTVPASSLTVAIPGGVTAGAMSTSGLQISDAKAAAFIPLVDAPAVPGRKKKST